MKIRHLGRFSFELPRQFQPNKREQGIYGVIVYSKDKGTKSIMEHWKSNLHSIQSLDALNMLEEDILANVPSVFYEQKSSPRMITLSAQIESSESVLTATLEGKKDQQANILKLVRIVLENYQHGDGFGFHVGSGVLLSEPGNIEYATATFTNNLNNIEFEISIDAAGNILSDDPLKDLEQDIPLFKDEGVDIELLQKRETKIGKLEGVEYLTSISEESSNKLFIYSWFFAGEPNNFLMPEISIKAIVPEKDKKYFEEDWDTIIHSLIFRE